jgi:diguanylate cyclase (GGDEF)-like protein
MAIDYRISRFTAEFADAQVELAFRQATHRAQVRETRGAIAIAALFYLIFSGLDFMHLGFGEAYRQTFITRVSVAGLGLLVALTAQRFWRALMDGVTPTLAVGVALAGFLSMTLLRPYDLGTQNMSFMVMLLGAYVFIPNRFMLATLLGVVASVAFLWLINQHFQPSLLSIGGIALLLVVVNLFGIRTAYRVSLMTRVQFRDIEILRDANKRLAEEVAQRQRLEAELRVLLDRDELTGALNRSHFLTRTDRSLSSARLQDEPICLLRLDVDYFKQINDTYGHIQGDRVLLALVTVCQRLLREEDLLARLDGEKFAVLLPNMDIRAALLVAERLRGELKRERVNLNDVTLHFTASIGVAQWRQGESIDMLLKRSDKSCQVARENGGNRVEQARTALESVPLAGQNGESLPE